jgi:hypothetical protein
LGTLLAGSRRARLVAWTPENDHMRFCSPRNYERLRLAIFDVEYNPDEGHLGQAHFGAPGTQGAADRHIKRTRGQRAAAACAHIVGAQGRTQKLRKRVPQAAGVSAGRLPSTEQAFTAAGLLLVERSCMRPPQLGQFCVLWHSQWQFVQR